MTELVSIDQARQLTDRIKVAVEGTWLLIQEAYTSRTWSVLGYETWDAYCSAEFGASRLRLPREERQEVVASLREIGMSVRAIASATGQGYGTVRRELAGEPNGSPAPVPDPFAPAPSSPAPRADQLTREEPATVTGTDGKTYQARPERARPRPKLSAQFTTASADLSRLVARFERLVEDDRYAPNRDVIAELCTPEIRRAVQVLDGLLRDLAPERERAS